MQGLYKKVCEGNVPLLPNCFSKELYYVVKLMLQQQPKLRPSCSEILSKSQVIRNMPNKLILSAADECQQQ